MVTVTSKEAKEKFGVVMDQARTQDVTITKHSRPSVVVMSIERYNQLEALEEAMWALKAKQAEKNGYLGTEASEAFIQEMLNA